MSTELLRVDNLRIGTSADNVLLRGINFSIQQGETLALLGESGSGKSLAAMSVMRLLPDAIRVFAGAIYFKGEDLFALPENQMRFVRGRKIAVIFQEPMTALNPVKTIGDQAMEVVFLSHRLRIKEARHRVLSLFERVGLSDTQRVFNAYQHELSGGMRQRAMIAMALAGEPDLLIADEPTTALDVTTEAQVLDLIKSLQRKLGMTMLFISHDLSVVSNIADKVAVMRGGEILDSGEMRGFFSKQRHPYSMQLRDAIPGLGTRGKRLSVSDGVDSEMDSESGANSELLQAKDCTLEVSNLCVDFAVRGGLLRRVVQKVSAVSDVSLSLKRGQTLALVGESGSGKTSVAKAILRIIPTVSGQVLFGGVDVMSLTGRDLLAYYGSVQIVFQDPFSSLNPKQTIAEILAEGVLAQKMAMNKAEILEHSASLLNDVGLENQALQRYPHEFSGGQRQRICIARALSVSPSLIICDEPTSALDALVQAQILDLCQNLQQRFGLSYLFISHDLSVVAHIADYIMVMQGGRVVEQGDAKSVLQTPQADYTKTLLASVPKLRID